MLSKSANPSLVTPSQAPGGEGVETGWEPPDRVTAKVKAQSRPRTLTMRAAAKAEVAWDQESPGSSPGGAIRKRDAVIRVSRFGLIFWVTLLAFTQAKLPQQSHKGRCLGRGK